MNIPMINLVCNNLRCSDTVYSSTVCRVSYIWLYIRIPIIQLSILSLQDCPTLSIAIISLQEILKLGSSVYTYAKYKHLKNVTLALLECSQSIFILVFLLLLLMISYNSQQVYHTLGMYTIIAACCIEYLLFLAYICYTLYVNLRTKRYAKQNNLKFNSYSLIVSSIRPLLPSAVLNRITENRSKTSSYLVNMMKGLTRNHLVPPPTKQTIWLYQTKKGG